MVTPQDFTKVINVAILIVTIMYILTGVLGYILFGENVNAVITDSLPNTSLVTLLRWCLIIGIALTFPVQFLPLIDLIDMFILPKFTNTFHLNITASGAIIRVTIVAISLIVAVFIPFLGLITNLIGGFSAVLAAFIIPPIIYLKLYWYHLPNPEIIVCLAIILFGIIGLSVSSSQSVYEIIQQIGTNVTLS